MALYRLGIKQFFRWLRWLWDGKPVVTYPGYHCGCCGAWTWEKFSILTYKSYGEWWDMWGLCRDECEETSDV